LQVTGTPRVAKVKWHPDAFAFVGFPVAAGTGLGPTFAQWFAGSAAHAAGEFYTLSGDHWTRIASPSAVNIADGQAYWVHTTGGSEHRGPLTVKLPGVGDELRFSPQAASVSVAVTNRSPHPLSFTLEQVAGAGDPKLIPLSLVTTSRQGVTTYTPFTRYTPTAALAAGETHTVRLAVRQLDLESPTVSGLLKLADDLGDVIYIPMYAEKLEGTAVNFGTVNGP
jgi:hypothetical protein